MPTPAYGILKRGCGNPGDLKNASVQVIPDESCFRILER
jgi:hypothetical protein